MKVKWACPKCGAGPNRHGKGGASACAEVGLGFSSWTACHGFLCECTAETEKNHGTSQDDPCSAAACYHCGWSGTFPLPPFQLKGWAKTAWDEGWRPPAGWQPKVKV